MRHRWEEGTREVKCLRPGCPWRKRAKQRTTGEKRGPAAVAVEFSNNGQDWATLAPYPPCEGKP